MSERDFLRWLREQLPPYPESVHIGIGPDDCAFISPTPHVPLAITTDTLSEGTHFSSEDAPHDVGWKAVAVNLSDLAASGCMPAWAVTAAAIRSDAGEAWAEGFAEGMLDAAAAYGLSIVGGDTTSTTGPTCITITAFGHPICAHPLLRGDAKENDVLVVTGTLGGSFCGKHLHPLPRLPEIRTILQHTDVHACMDISDGLALDLSRLTRESHCGAIIEEMAIPIAEAAWTMAAKSGQSALQHALADGEDFELLFTLAPDDWKRLKEAWPGCGFDTPLTAIGRIANDPGLEMQDAAGVRRPLSADGYEHQF